MMLSQQVAKLFDCFILKVLCLINPNKHSNQLFSSCLIITTITTIVNLINCQRCPQLRAPPYGYLIRPCSTNIGDNCNIDCDIGFEILGPSYRLCRRNGSWSGSETQCVKSSLSCPPIRTSSYNNLIVKDCRNIAGGLCQFECLDSRDDLHGKSKIYCRTDGRWSDAIPFCRSNSCPPPPSPPNYGAYVGECNSQIGSYCSYRCYNGFAIVGNQTIHCLSHGQWSSEAPFCNRLARFSSCPPLFPPENGSTSGKCGPIIATDEECRFACNSGFKLNGEANLTCKDTGKWSAETPTCSQNECPALNIPTGIITAGQCNPGFPGNSCMIYCSTVGSSLSSPSILTCTEDGHWTGNLPMCIAQQNQYQNCPSINSPANGLASGYCNPGNIGKLCTFICAPDYTLNGPRTIQCMANGQWSALPPVCNRFTSSSSTSSTYSCPDLVAPIGGFYKSNMNCPKCPNNCQGNTNGDCTLFCGQGYQLTGKSATSFCNAKTLRWDPDPATCISQAFSSFMTI